MTPDDQNKDIAAEANRDPLHLSFSEELEEEVNKMEWPDRKAVRLEQRAIEYGQVPIGIDCRIGLVVNAEASNEKKLNSLKAIREEVDTIIAQGDELIEKIKDSNKEADYQIEQEATDFIRESQELLISTIIPSLEEIIKKHS